MQMTFSGADRGKRGISLRDRWTARLLSSLFVLPLALSGCVGNDGDLYPQSTVDPRSDFGEVIQSLYQNVFWWSAIILAVVWIALAYILVRFRERPEQAKPRQVHGHLGLEIGWTVAPALIVVAIAIPTIQGVFATQRPQAEDSYVVEVRGNQFWWEFHYPEEGITTANELHLPANRPVALHLSSRDVIHSFWVPLLGGKRDVNPVVAEPDGQLHRPNFLYFTAYEPGVYLGQCAEFCGEAHAFMGIRTVVHTDDDFAAWAEGFRTATPPAGPGATAPGTQDAPMEMPDAPPVVGREIAGTQPFEGSQEELEQIAMGADVFHNVSYCALCHAIENTPAGGRLGPDLTLLGTRSGLAANMIQNTPENLVRWIRDPRSVKPGALMPGVAESIPRAEGGEWPATELDDEQLEALAAYLSSLR
jgi:cytochrome c oxidase subunit II